MIRRRNGRGGLEKGEAVIRWALIGAGEAAIIHLNALKGLSTVDVQAIADLDRGRAMRVAKRYGIPHYYDSYEDMLKRTQVDLADICTPTSTHRTVATDVANLGVDILLEKPMARSSSQCREIMDSARSNNVRLCVCHNKRFFPGFLELARNRDKGEEVRFVETVHYAVPPPGHWTTRPEEGGILWEEGVHQAYIQLHLLSRFEDIFAIAVKDRYDVEDTVVGILSSNGVPKGIMNLSWTLGMAYDYVRILAGKTLKFVDLSYLQTKESSKRGLVRKGLGLLESHLRPKPTAESFVSHHERLFNELVDALHWGRPVPVLPEEGLATVRMLECIEISLAQKTKVLFSED